MISEETRKIIIRYIEDYESEMRFNFLYLECNYHISEVSPEKFIVLQSGLIVDRDQDYGEILRHPVEDTFVPETVESFNIEFTIQLKLPELKELTGFAVSSDFNSQEISIEDPRITDEHLKLLLDSSYFNETYLESEPEVREYLREIYNEEHSLDRKAFLERLRPLLGL